MMTANSKTVSLFACPICTSALVENAGSRLCTQCGKAYEEVEGIPVFTRDREQYFTFVAREVVDRVLHESAAHGWDEAMQSVQREYPEAMHTLFRRTSDEARGAGKFLLSLGPQARVLDIGCGMGALSFSFARSCGEVVSMDSTLGYLRWIRLYAAEMGLTNIVPVCGGDEAHLPFQNETFDAVVMSGVWEYMALAQPGEPTAVQQAFLRDVARVLKPGGEVYIGIENRLSWRYFRGRPEEHTKMRFAALLPRPLSNALHKRKYGREFRIYTYSMRGYRHWLRQAGFSDTEFYYPLPEYSNIGRLLPLEENSRRALLPVANFAPTDRRERRQSSPVGRCFARSFVIVGHKGKKGDSLLQELLVAARAACLDPALARDAWTLEQYEVRRQTGKLHLHLRASDGTQILGKVPFDATKQRLVRANYEVLEFLWKSPVVGEPVKRLLPRVLGRARAGGHDIYLEEWRPAAELRRSGPLKEQLAAEARQFLLQLQCDTQERRSVDEALFADLFGAPLRDLAQWFSPAERPQWESRLRNLESFCRERVIGAELPLVVRHGDFGLTNCLYDPRSQHLSIIVDWDGAALRSLPLMDLMRLEFQLDKRSRDVPRDSLLEHGLRGFPELLFDESHRALYDEMLRALHIDERLFLPLAVMYWAPFVNRHRLFARCRWNPQWSRDNVAAILNGLSRQLNL